jgi:hypothetical protein
MECYFIHKFICYDGIDDIEKFSVYKLVDNQVYIYDFKLNDWLAINFMGTDYITSLEQISREEALDILFLEGL